MRPASRRARWHNAGTHPPMSGGKGGGGRGTHVAVGVAVAVGVELEERRWRECAAGPDVVVGV